MTPPVNVSAKLALALLLLVEPPPDVSGSSSQRAMSKESNHQDLSALSSCKNGLVYLTANDWTLIADKATRMQFKAGQQFVRRGTRTHGIYLVVKGIASVQMAGHALAREIGPGEVCGEISFLDELPATADVVAKDAVLAYYLDRPTLVSLFELFPHLGSRFYRSLASILSRRLREVIDKESTFSAKKSSS
jgi:CRP-like cAMP-binding protein